MSDFEQYLIDSFGETWERSGIMDAYNAALAAEREKRMRWHQDDGAHIEELEQQLAAEREKVQTLTGTLTKALDAVNSYADEESTDIFYGELRQEVENWIRAEDNPGFHRHE